MESNREELREWFEQEFMAEEDLDFGWDDLTEDDKTYLESQRSFKFFQLRKRIEEFKQSLRDSGLQFWERLINLLTRAK